jgi:hypothetical protein
MSLFQRLGYFQREESLDGIPVVLAALIDYPDISVGCGLVIRNDSI